MIVRSCLARRTTQICSQPFNPLYQRGHVRNFHPSSRYNDDNGMPNYYETLDIPTNASPGEIKKYTSPMNNINPIRIPTNYPIDNSTNSPNPTTQTCTPTTATPPTASYKSARPTQPSAAPTNAPATIETSYALRTNPPPPTRPKAASHPPRLQQAVVPPQV